MIAKQRQLQEKKIRLATTRVTMDIIDMEESWNLTETTIWYHMGITIELRFVRDRHDWGKLTVITFILHIHYFVSLDH
jgi:hypothetical protein